MPRFHCLLPVRDEADIIEECLDHLLKWADAIYIYDTGSVDSTWEIIQGLAAREKRIVFLKKADVYFSETHLRSCLFHQARVFMKSDDWFLRVDADEFHHIPPPDFVKDRLKSHETIVYHQYYDFRLTESDVQAWETGAETLEDRRRPIEKRRRWFTPSLYSEPRLCRYRETMKWPCAVSFPYNAGFVARSRLPIRHYPHRDPVQMARRCHLRSLMMSDPNHDGQSFDHWRRSDWHDFVIQDVHPELVHWNEGEDLPEYNYLTHLANPGKRLAQRLVHKLFLRWLDANRLGYLPSDEPTPLPFSLIERLRNELGENGDFK